MRTVMLNDTSTKDSIDSYVKENRFVGGLICPLCKSKKIIRNGHRVDGTQRYICKTCNKSFVSTTNSVTSSTKKDFATWNKYIDCMMEGLSVRKFAELCKISVTTSFIWRHKLLDTLQGMHNFVELDGIVEADETFFPISYKGNHSKSTIFTMPRKAHKRGKDHEYKFEEQADGTIKKRR